MQYGDLTEAQLARFSAAQAYPVRQPNFVVWIEGFGDPTDYVIDIDSEIALESAQGSGHISLGRAILSMSNEDGYFYSDGKSKVEKNAKMKVWAGIDNLNVPIFTGIVHSVRPMGTTDMVVLDCRDYMALFQELLVKRSQDPNNTAKLLIENFCDLANLPAPNVVSTDETADVYTEPTFEEQSVLMALEEVCNSIFYVAHFDEEGKLRAVEREHSTLVDFQFNDNNVIDFENLADTEIVNDITIEYGDNFFSSYEDQASIDAYGRRARRDRILLLNSVSVSGKTTGSTAAELDHDLEAFQFTSASEAASMDSLHVKMKKSDAHGYLTAQVYSDGGGVPSNLLATSQLKASDSLSGEFSWEIFYFSAPVEISPSTDYWVVIDAGSVSSGNVYVQTSEEAVSGKHAYYSGTWQTEDNKQVLHRLRGSVHAQRVAQDVVRFCRDPHERIRITAPAVPQLQLLDEVMVDVSLRGVQGHYVIERRRHVITPDKYTTIDTLRKAE